MAVLCSLFRLAFLASVASASVADVAQEACASGGASRAGVCKDLQGEEATGVATQLLQKSSQRHGDVAADGAARLSAKQIPGWSDLTDAVSSVANDTMGSLSDSLNSAVNSVANVSSISDALGDISGAVSNSSSISDAMGSLANASSISDAVGVIAGAASNASSISDAIGSIASSVNDSISDATGELADSAAAAVAAVLNQSIAALGSQADAFSASCEQTRASLLEQMNQTKMKLVARAAVLQANATAAISAALPKWQEISGQVGTASVAVSAVLNSVGLSELSNTLNSSLSEALKHADFVASSLQNVSGILSGITAVAEKAVGEQLDQVQSSLQAGLEQVDSFARNLSAAFGDLTDEAAAKIAATIPGANASSIDAVFDAVDASVAELAAKVVVGPEALVSGLSEAAGMVADTLPEARSSAHRATFMAASVVFVGMGMGFAANA